MESTLDESATIAGGGEDHGVKQKQKEEQELKRLEIEMENVRLASSTDGPDTADDECVLITFLHAMR